MSRRSFDSDATVVADCADDARLHKAKILQDEDASHHTIRHSPFQRIARAVHGVVDSIYRHLPSRSSSSPQERLVTDDLMRALSHSRGLTPVAVIEAVWRVVVGRDGAATLDGELPLSLASSLLSKRREIWEETWISAVTTVHKAFVDLEPESPWLTESDLCEEARYRALVILLYDARHSLSEIGAQVLRDLLSDAHEAADMPIALSGWYFHHEKSLLCDYSCGSPRGTTIATLLLDALSAHGNIVQCAGCVGVVLRTLLCLTGRFGELLSSSGQLRRLVDARNLACSIDVSGELEGPETVENLLVLLVLQNTNSLAASMSASSVARHVLFKGPEFMYNYISAIAARRAEERLGVGDRYMFEFTEVFCRSSLSERHTLLQSACKMCELYRNEALSDKRLYAEQDFVQICVLFLKTQRTLENQTDVPDEQTQKLWWDFWTVFAGCLRKYHLQTINPLTIPVQNRTAHQAGRCLETISTWTDRGDHVLRHPEELFRALELFAFQMDVEVRATFVGRQVENRDHSLG